MAVAYTLSRLCIVCLSFSFAVPISLENVHERQNCQSKIRFTCIAKPLSVINDSCTICDGTVKPKLSRL